MINTLTALISDLAGGHIAAFEYGDNAIDYIEIDESPDDNGLFAVTGRADVRWSTLGLDVTWNDAAWNEVDAIASSLKGIYNATEFDCRDHEDDDGLLAFGWTISILPSASLQDAIDILYGLDIIAFHNALNGGFRARNAYADAQAALAAFQAAQPRIEAAVKVYLVWDNEQSAWRIDLANFDGSPLDFAVNPYELDSKVPEEAWERAAEADAPTGEELARLLADALPTPTA